MGFRSSVFSVVGEMDHGKTTLLDYLQHSEIQKQEFGGTTQLIRANSLTLEYRNESNKVANYPCTFLDTPGQSCFADVFSFRSTHHSSYAEMEVYYPISPSILSPCTKVPRKKPIIF